MGNLFSGLFEPNITLKQHRIVMLGLDGSGKTTILYKLKLNENVQTSPTNGFNIETIKHNNIHFTVYDLGGKLENRQLRQPYLEKNDAIIFVVDSNDIERMDEVRETLHKVLSNSVLEKTKVLIFINKQDLPSAMETDQVFHRLRVKEIKQEEWKVQPCSGLTGMGLFEGFGWLLKQLYKL